MVMLQVEAGGTTVLESKGAMTLPCSDVAAVAGGKEALRAVKWPAARQNRAFG